MKNINDSNVDEILNSKSVVFIKIGGEWCRSCDELDITMTQLSKEFTNVEFVKGDIKNNSILRQKHRIKGLPTVLVYKDGRLFRSLASLKNIDEYREVLRG